MASTTTMRLWAIADIHLSFKTNKEEFAKLHGKGPDDGLILAGDVGENLETLNEAFRLAKKRFKHVFWVPGNHELYTSKTHVPDEEKELKGEAKYMACVAVAKKHGVLTPEDDFMTWVYEDEEGFQVAATICPIFTLYDYTFRPEHVTREGALEWAMEEGIKATDETLLHPDPYDTRDEWCARLVEQTETKLQNAADSGFPLVIINHWPLREDTVFIPRVPRFSLWCGTTKTKNWHTKYHAKVVVTGHLHVRRTDWIDGVRFEECSLGYPRQWQEAKDEGHNVNTLLREILPGPPTPKKGQEPTTTWRGRGRGWSLSHGMEPPAPDLRCPITPGSPSSRLGT
ncbi:Calcineurin-like phosphoesterase [Teratosphaeria destructans]|uniref:Calcineurin-like phosphoesterase n=1 Tax=Teratosphaeria destructans TaxID=418781 RepID=A0A9W7SHD7_9PEZI|nr:Calcineurin-like phosphoesterase [Teratosphaeria destructans]